MPTREQLLQYEIAKCLKRGLCLEVCPNYMNGNTFFRRALRKRLLPGCYAQQDQGRRDQGPLRRALRERLLQGAFLHGRMSGQDFVHRVDGSPQSQKEVIVQVAREWLPCHSVPAHRPSGVRLKKRTCAKARVISVHIFRNALYLPRSRFAILKICTLFA